jgi:hypothetical protein
MSSGDQHLRVLGAAPRPARPVRPAVDRAGGVGRAVDDEHPGLRRDRRFQLRRGDLEALFDAGLDDHRLAVGEDDDVGYDTQ